MTLVQDVPPPMADKDRPSGVVSAFREDGSGGLRRWIGFFGGAVLFVGMVLMAPPDGLTVPGWRTAALGLLMGIWWITEALPIAVTSLLPLVFLPLLQIADIDDAAAPYANPLIFLFLGGFVLALGMEKWGLHRRIALNVVHRIGTRPDAIVAGFMVSTGFISMWVSNTATALMMLPIGMSVVQVFRARVAGHPDRAKDERNFSAMLMLTIAFASSIGGMATLIGTPTNALFAGFLDETYGLRISFVQWMAVGVPLILVGLPLTFFLLKLLFPVRLERLPGGEELVRGELERIGRITRPEIMVAITFGCVALLWITRPLIEDVVPGISDTGIAIFGAVSLFILPVDARRGEFVLDWQTAERLPWGALLLFGGGLSIAAAIQTTGLGAWIGQQMSGIGDWPAILILLVVVSVVVVASELTSNTATAAAFLPIVGAVAIGIGENPLLLLIPTVLAASCGFMLPVATPPNAIVYGSGAVDIRQMVRAGLWLDVLFILLVTAFAYTLVLFVFDIVPGVIPEWAG